MRKTALALVATIGGLAAVISSKATSLQALATTGSATTGSTTTQAGQPLAPAPAAPAGAPAPAPGGGTGAAGTRVVTGPVVPHQYGPVQVQVALSGNRITDISAVQLPKGGHSDEVNGRAAPILRQEALTAQSANIDTVSGATYTSDAYRRSLQAALDSARK